MLKANEDVFWKLLYIEVSIEKLIVSLSVPQNGHTAHDQKRRPLLKDCQKRESQWRVNPIYYPLIGRFHWDRELICQCRQFHFDGWLRREKKMVMITKLIFLTASNNRCTWLSSNELELNGILIKMKWKIKQSTFGVLHSKNKLSSSCNFLAKFLSIVFY